MKQYVKIDRKVLFEICDAILGHVDMQMKISAQRMMLRAFGIIGIKNSAER